MWSSGRRRGGRRFRVREETKRLGALADRRYFGGVSPTVFRASGFRFYFFSREEERFHVHVQHADGEAKFWLEPTLELAHNYRLRANQLAAAEKLIKEHEDAIRAAWAKHFPR